MDYLDGYPALTGGDPVYAVTTYSRELRDLLRAQLRPVSVGLTPATGWELTEDAAAYLLLERFVIITGRAVRTSDTTISSSWHEVAWISDPGHTPSTTSNFAVTTSGGAYLAGVIYPTNGRVSVRRTDTTVPINSGGYISLAQFSPFAVAI